MCCHITGKSKIGAFIRKIDYLNAKDRNDYENSDDYPGRQLNKLEDSCREDMSFEDFKVCEISTFFTPYR